MVCFGVLKLLSIGITVVAFFLTHYNYAIVKEFFHRQARVSTV